MNAQIVLENIGIRLPNRVLFEQVNWTLFEGMRVALAGRNGSGKSTLLKILSGQGESTEGQCSIVGGKNLKIGFLDQSLLDRAVVEAVNSNKRDLSAVDYIQERLRHTRDESESHEALEWETKKILSGLGFSDEQMQVPFKHLSGGWLLRMFIAATLLDQPDVLLLDEPTNHLDISSIQWLEEFLIEEYKGSIVLVTHDIALQKKVTDSLAILHGGRFFFRSHQKDYLTFKNSLQEEKVLIEKAIESLDKKIAEHMDFVERFRAKAQTAARAQSKLRMAEDLIQEQNVLKDRLQRIVGFSYNLNFRFRMKDAGSKFPISFKNMNFKYPTSPDWVSKNVTFDTKRGQKIAIMGDNGMGKTTLLNLIAGRLRPTEGVVEVGQNVDIGYFGQHQLDELNLEGSVFDNLKDRSHGVGIEQLRGWLGAFGFGSNDEINKKAKVLSGGERARLALLRILATPVNLILLDEPTNHLDVETKALLMQAMREFEGTVMFVSHDREFVSEIAERILYISHDHTLTDHIGNLESFFKKYPQFVKHLEGSKASQKAAAAEKEETSEKSDKPELSYEERKKIRNRIKSLEKKIAAAEQQMSSTDGESSNLLSEWESWSKELEELRKLR
jgi:ATP-binding cassette subfamily F protein 3